MQKEFFVEKQPLLAGPSHFDQLMSLQRWTALMGTGTTESNLFHLLLTLTVVQHIPTGAGGGGKGRPSSLGKILKKIVS